MTMNDDDGFDVEFLDIVIMGLVEVVVGRSSSNGSNSSYGHKDISNVTILSKTF
jgi:hypothetical protein